MGSESFCADSGIDDFNALCKPSLIQLEHERLGGNEFVTVVVAIAAALAAAAAAAPAVAAAPGPGPAAARRRRLRLRNRPQQLQHTS